MQLTENCGLDEKVYRWLIREFDSRNGGLTEAGFIQVCEF